MNSFTLAFEAVAPIVLMVALGYLLKRLGWMSERFATEANRIASGGGHSAFQRACRHQPFCL